MSVSVIVPIYNEERRIARTVFELNDYLENHFRDFELIVVDDGSDDGSLSVLKELPFPCLKVLSLAEHQGRGEAIRIGFSHAVPYDNVVLFDADLSVSPTVIERLTEALHTTDTPFVVTEPTVSFNSYYHRLSPLRYRRLGLALLGISHVACGTKCLTASFARLVIPKTRMRSKSLDAELVFLAQEYGVRPITLPVSPQEKLVEKSLALPFFGTLALIQIRRLASRGVYRTEKTKEWGGI